MSEFTNFEPVFQESLTLILNRIKDSQIYILSEGPLSGLLYWLKLAEFILGLASHGAGVMERSAQGADLVQLSIDLSTTLMFFQVICLYMQLYVNRKLIKNFIIHLGSNWRTDDQLRPEMVAMKHKYLKSFTKLITVFDKLLRAFISLYMLLPLLWTAVKLFILRQDVVLVAPFYFKLPFRYDDNFWLFSLASVIDAKMILDISYMVTYDLLLMNASMFNLRLLFVMLRDDLRSIVPGEGVDPKGAVMRLKRIIPQHISLLQLMLELSNAFGAIFFIHLAFYSVTTCFFGFTTRVHCSPESSKILIGCAFTTFCIYKCCSYGQDLTDASLNIAETAYVSQWHLMSVEYRKCMILIMLRSQRTQYIKSTGFTHVSLQTFTKILNATWTFLSIITNVYED